MSRILIVTDAWHPQVNGVVRTMETVVERLRARGHAVAVISPDAFNSIPAPTYPEIRLALFPRRGIEAMIDQFEPDYIHISTEGPLGWSARALCRKRGLAFTTSYHTRFPEYICARLPVPLSWGYAAMRRFHRDSQGIMVATPSLKRDLAGRGFANITDWTRGVDLDCFNSAVAPALDLPKPVSVYVGRVSVEKNIEDFLRLDLPGSKLVVGDGPQLESLKKAYPDVTFAGARFGEDLAAHYASGDVFVFPSKTDTFGLVMLEAMACGLPVAAYPVTGPLDVVGDSGAAALDEDLSTAVKQALAMPRDQAQAAAERHARRFSWDVCVQQFLDNLAPLPGGRRQGAQHAASI